MKEELKFLLKVSELKNRSRTGWIWAGIKNSETIAEHTFRLTIASWLLAKKRKLNTLRAIKIALFHDICEVYAGDITPVLYYPHLPKDKERRKKVLMKGIRLSQKEKERIGEKKFKRERRALLKLTKFLKPDLKNEILSLWAEYEKGSSPEGRFNQQLNRIETLLQSIEYFGVENVTKRTNWWEWANEIVSDPLLLDFLKVIEKKFYGYPLSSSPEIKELESILDFLLEVGKLKKMPRKGWVLRGVKNPETMAGHIFESTLMAWLFLKKSLGGLNEEKILKMGLSHELCSIYTNDKTPYDKILEGKSEKEKREILKKWIRFSKKEKAESFLEEYREEKRVLRKLTSKLENSLKNEIIQAWEEFKTIGSPEARFFTQIDVLAALLQSILYWEKDKNFPIAPFWEWAFEINDGQMNLEFMEELKQKFYKKKSLLRTFLIFLFRKTI